MKHKRTTGTQKLTREQVIAAAGRMLGESGVDGLSMRRLARELSVSASTLYWHVQDKQELLQLVVDEAVGMIEVAQTADWRGDLADFLRRSRQLLRERPALISLIWGSGWTLGPQTLRVTNDVLGRLAASGAREEDIPDLYYLLITFLFGFVLLEIQSPNTPGFTGPASSGADQDPFPFLSRYAPAADSQGMDRRFEHGVQSLLNSLTQPS